MRWPWGQSPKNNSLRAIQDALDERWLDKYSAHRDETDALSNVQALLNEVPACAAAFALICPDPATTALRGRKRLLHGEVLDLTHRAMLSAVLEAVVCELLVPLCSEIRIPAELEIHLGTRRRDVPDAAAKRCIEELYGIRIDQAQNSKTRRTEYFYESVSPKDCAELLLEVLARRDVPQTIAVGRARAAMLVEKDQLQKWATEGRAADQLDKMRYTKPRQAHYLADWVGRILRRHNGGPGTPPVVGQWLSRGFLDTPENADRWLLVGGALDRGEAAEATHRAALAIKSRSGSGQHGLGQLVLRRMEKALRALDGDDFITFCDKADRWHKERMVRVAGIPANTDETGLSTLLNPSYSPGA